MGGFSRFARRGWRFLRATIPIAGGLAVLVLVIAWLSGAFETKIEPVATPVQPVQLTDQPTDIVHEVTKDYIEEAIGTLKASSRSVISAKVLARIDEIAVTAGDHVEAGDLLIRLDNQDLQARLKQAEQSLVAAKATRREAQAAYDRIAPLVESGTVTQGEFDVATRQLEVARAEEARAEQTVNEAQVQISYTIITAPKSGRIVDRLAEPGDTARPGEPLLVLYDATSLRLEAPVPEQLAVKLHVGDQLQVSIDALDREVEATIGEIVPEADAPSRSFLVKANLPESEDLYEGMFGRLRIPAGQRRHLCLATSAIHRVGQLAFVEVVNEDGSLEKRFIKTGRVGMPGRIEVLSGLKMGERVVLSDSPPPSNVGAEGNQND